MSRILPASFSTSRPFARSRVGGRLRTDIGEILEVAGGSHASCIVNDGGSVLAAAVERFSTLPLPCTNRAVTNAAQDELGERVCDLLGDTGALVYFTSGGTEAVETAVRLAHHVQRLRGRVRATVIVGRPHSYHGMSLLTRNIANHPVHSTLPEGLDFHWPKLPEPRRTECAMCSSKSECDLQCLEPLETILASPVGDTIAAVIAEPVSGTTGGALVTPKGYMERLSEICRRNEVLVIADETVTAFGRTGSAFSTNGRIADIIVGGKCLGGGLVPVNAVLLSSPLVNELARTAEELPLRLTFAGNPLCCLVALCAQDYVKRLDLWAAVLRNTEVIEAGLARRLGGAPGGVLYSGVGHLWSLQLPVAKGTAVTALDILRRSAARRGAEFMGGIIVGAQRDYAHLMFTPAFDLSDHELDAMLDASADAVLEASTQVAIVPF